MSVIFTARMESDLSEWTSEVDADGDLIWAAAAGLAGSSGGIQITVDDANPAYLTKTGFGNTSGKARARFYFDPNTPNTTNGDLIRLFQFQNATTVVGGVEFSRGVSNLNINVFLVDDGGSVRRASSTTITDAPHWIEVYLTRAATSVSADGDVHYWVDGVDKGGLATLRDNYDRFNQLGYAILGYIGSLSGTPTGTWYYDELVINDDGSSIGAYHAPVSLGGTLTPAGGLVNQARKLLAGVLDWAGDLATQFTGGGGGTEYPQAVGGTLTPDGSLARRTAKVLAGAFTPDGALVRMAKKVVSGTLNFIGIGEWLKQALISLGGTLTPAGEVVKRSAKGLAGTLTPDGGLVRRAGKALAGVLNQAGGLAAELVEGAQTFFQSVAGTLDSSGELAKRTGKVLAGALTPAGEVVKRAGKAVAGSLAPDGALARTTGKALAGILTPAGTVVKRISRALAGALSWAGTLLGVYSPPATGIVELTLYPRSVSMTLEDRSEDLTLHPRSVSLTLPER